MLSYSDLKKGITFIYENQPYQVLESSLMFKGRGSSVIQVKIRNLSTGSILSKTFHPGDEFEEAEIERIKARFLYSHRDKFVFCKENDPSARFELTKETIGEGSRFLKPNEMVEGLVFEDKVINISLPIKVHLKVTEAPPGLRGDRAQSGTKMVTLETGAQIAVPLFIEEGDIIEINTEREEYVRRVSE